MPGETHIVEKRSLRLTRKMPSPFNLHRSFNASTECRIHSWGMKGISPCPQKCQLSEDIKMHTQERRERMEKIAVANEDACILLKVRIHQRSENPR